MSEQSDDRLPRLEPPEELAAANDDAARPELDSEPRRKWQPKPELIRALEATQKDLRPGEASLFWDWTATRNSAPAAEDVRPSGEGDVLVSFKDAAAAYVPPKQIAPAAAPRRATRSRIRVREDIDPRRQPTVRTPRSSEPGDAPPSTREPGDTAPPSAREPRDTAPPESRTQRSGAVVRRRRVAWMAFAAVTVAAIVFFWLRLPAGLDTQLLGDRRPPVEASLPPAECTACTQPEQGALDPSAGATLRADSSDRAAAPPADSSGSAAPQMETPGDARPGPPRIAPGPRDEAAAAPRPPSAEASSSPGPRDRGAATPSAPRDRGSATPGARGEARPTPPRTGPSTPAAVQGGGFLIRKKGDGSQ
jgi:hypothetical protein